MVSIRRKYVSTYELIQEVTVNNSSRTTLGDATLFAIFHLVITSDSPIISFTGSSDVLQRYRWLNVLVGSLSQETGRELEVSIKLAYAVRHVAAAKLTELEQGLHNALQLVEDTNGHKIYNVEATQVEPIFDKIYEETFQKDKRYPCHPTPLTSGGLHSQP
eukprot:717334-Pyramimonas_sp.AAC.1